jgi:hypothetical protein
MNNIYNEDKKWSMTRTIVVIFCAFLLGMIIAPKSKTETITKEVPKEVIVNNCDHDLVWLKIKSIDEKLYRNTSYRIEYSDRIVRSSFEKSNKNMEVYKTLLDRVNKEDEDLQIQRIDLLKSIGY